MPYFQYHAAILAAYPQVAGGIIVADGVQNAPTPDDLKTLYLAEQKATLARIGETPLSELASISAWRRAFRAFGVDPTQYRSASEALLRRLTKKGDIPFINTLVDIGNLVSIRYGLPIALVDRQTIQGGITVHFADGSEIFTELDNAEIVYPEAGEVVFTDDSKTVFARRWCWRQSENSATRETTTHLIVTIEAHHENGANDVQAAMQAMLALMQQYAGGSYQSALLNSQNPAL
jgi:DNA/RNA-binding domain of Phe-tRNA-synthetase-like protein